MIAGFEWVAPGISDTWCIRRLDATRMLCGTSFYSHDGRAGFVPTVQPVDPNPKCPGCLNVMYGRTPRRGALPKPVTGECPVCGGSVAVLCGRVEAHGEVRIRDGREFESDVPCVGMNLRVKRVRR